MMFCVWWRRGILNEGLGEMLWLGHVGQDGVMDVLRLASSVVCISGTGSVGGDGSVLMRSVGQADRQTVDQPSAHSEEKCIYALCHVHLHLICATSSCRCTYGVQYWDSARALVLIPTLWNVVGVGSWRNPEFPVW